MRRTVPPRRPGTSWPPSGSGGEDVFKSVSTLSGGELSRLKLCMLMMDSINLLVLDEPTNHLDVSSREWIEEAVEAFDGALLFVSHDRYFHQPVCPADLDSGERQNHRFSGRL